MRPRSAAVMILVLAGCAGETPEPEVGTVVSDSSGVRIAAYGAVSEAEWQIAETPLFVLGWGPDDPDFTWIPSGRILPDGGAVVGESAVGSLYRIGPGGGVSSVQGRKGEGPGEFQGLDGIALDGDGVVISDGRLRRITRVSLNGDSVTTRPLTGDFLHRVSSVLDDGRLVLVPGEGYSAAPEIRPEWVFETRPILAADLAEGSADTLAVLEHLRRWYGTRGGSPGPVQMKGRAEGLHDGFGWSRADEPEVRWYDQSGDLIEVVRWDETAPAMSPEFRDRVVQTFEDLVRGSGADDDAETARLADLEEQLGWYEGALPYWDEFHLDADGNAWLREYAPLGAPSSRWRVVDRERGSVNWIEVPDLITILDITSDRILGIRFDAFDVPAVVMLALSRK